MTDPLSYLDAKILVVDDERQNVVLLERLLGSAGFNEIRSVCDSRLVAGMMADWPPDIVLLDLHMPFLDGFAVLAQIRALMAPGEYLPVVVLTADATRRTRDKVLDAGASDFLTKPFEHSEVLLRIRNLIGTRMLHLQVMEQNANLEKSVDERTCELNAALADLKAAENQLVQQERLNAFGTMASGVAHDFNNVLGITLGFAELLLGGEGELTTKKRDQYAEAIITAAQDGSRMVSRLREFYRPSNGETWEQVDMSQLIQQAIDLTKPKWSSEAQRRDVSISVEADVEATPAITGLAAELREMLTNLIFNAVDAMPTGGAITLRARENAGEVVVEVEDSGSGMSEEVRRRCLEPFFSTKGTQGTGMGLAMVYGIAQRHDAHMDIQSQIGRGTTFRFRFPASALPATEHTERDPRLSRPLRIMVIDDQPFILESLALLLAQDCHVAECAEDGADAVERIRMSHFDLVITDQSMPGMSGGQIAAAVKEISPETRVILLTGFGADERPEEGAWAIDLVVGKPVTQEALRHAVAKVVSGCPVDEFDLCR